MEVICSKVDIFMYVTEVVIPTSILASKESTSYLFQILVIYQNNLTYFRQI